MRSVHTSEYRNFLRQLAAARRAVGLTQMEVAEALGIPQSRVSRLETGERRMDVIELASFAQLYRRPLGYFVKTGK